MQEFKVQVCKWRDKVNGNTYHNVIVLLDGKVLRSGFKYGYGNQYKETAVEMLKKEYPGIEVDYEQIVPVYEGYTDSEELCRDFRGVLIYEDK